MKVKRSDIASDLRIPGDFLKLITPYTSLKHGQMPAMNWLLKSNECTTELIRSDGSKMRLLVSIPKNKTNRKCPVVLWLHGGGYAGGFPEMIRISAGKELQNSCIVVSPDYALSYEHPYPAALFDAYRSLLWLKEHAEELGGRSDQIFVGGESAGGGLCVALCLLARDLGTVNIACQMPIYPMLDDRMKTNSMKNNDAPIWNEKLNRKAWGQYLAGQKIITEYAAPARARNYRNLPPAISFVGSVDPFYDEMLIYMHHLKQAGIPVHCLKVPAAFHAFDMMVPFSKEAKAARKFFRTQVEYATHHYFACQPHS